jgi:pimeloyl-ACP methyl ester carboxylesterase
VQKVRQNIKFFSLVCLSIILLLGFISPTYSGFASPESRTSMEHAGLNNITSTNESNIVLVHGAFSDGSVWSKVIPILMNAGHQVIAVQMPLHSLNDDIATVKRAIDHIGGPVTLVGHSYGGFVITNAAYNNPNVTGLVYIAALAPDEGETGNDFFESLPEEFSKTFFESIVSDSAGYLYFNPDKFRESFAQDVDPTEANIWATVQKPTNQSLTAEKSGSPAWKQLPTWYQISENDRLIPPDIQRLFAERMNATTLSLNSSHASLLSHPDDIAELILNATNGSKARLEN